MPGKFLFLINNENFLNSHRWLLVNAIKNANYNLTIKFIDFDKNVNLSPANLLIRKLAHFSNIFTAICLHKHDLIQVVTPKAIIFYMILNFLKKK